MPLIQIKTRTSDGTAPSSLALGELAFNTSTKRLYIGDGVSVYDLLANLPSGINAALIGDGSVSNTEFQYLNGLTGNIQNQIDTVVSTHNHDGDYAAIDHLHTGVYSPVAHTHPGLYYTQSDLNNAGNSAVHWDNLTNIPSILDNAADAFEATKEPTGFVDRADSFLSWDDATRTITIGPTGDDFVYWLKATQYTIESNKDLVVPETTGLHYIYLDTDEALHSTQTYSDALLSDRVLVASVYYSDDTIKATAISDERHLLMPWTTHRMIDQLQGTVYLSGFGITVNTSGDGSADTHAKLTVASGSIRDADIDHSLSGISPGTGNFPVLVPDQTASADVWDIVFSDIPAIVDTGVLKYRTLSGGYWEEQNVTDTYYVLTHILAVPDPRTGYTIVAVQGFGQYADIETARTSASPELGYILNLDFPYSSYTVLATLVLENDATFTNTYKARFVQFDDGRDFIDWRTSADRPGDTATYHTAAEITTEVALFDGYLSSADDNVQKALNTLDEHTHGSMGSGNGYSAGFTPAGSATHGDSFLRKDGTWQEVVTDLTGYATETFVTDAVADLVDSAPGTLDTLNELAAALGDDPNFATTVTNSIADKLSLTGGTLTDNTTLNKSQNSGTLFDIINTNVGADAHARLGLESDDGVAYLLNHATARTLARHGIAVGGWVELYAPDATNGIMIGTGTADTDIKFGTNNVIQATLNSTGLAVTGTVTGSNLNISNWDTAYGWGDHSGLYRAIDWVPALNDISDVNAPSPADTNVLAWNDTAGEWQPAAISGAGHNHDDIYYTQTQLQTSGQASVHWGNLTNLPSTFAPATHDNTAHSEAYITNAALSGYTQASVDEIITGNWVFSKENANSTLTILRGGTNIGSSDDVGTLLFQRDYDGTPENFAYIQTRTVINSNRANMEFYVKGYQGTMERAMAIQGRTAGAGPYVGIGVQSPTEKLDVDGNIKASGNVTGANLNISNWDTAYSWGDHSSEGYLTSADLSGYTQASVNETISGDWTFTGSTIVGAYSGYSFTILGGLALPDYQNTPDALAGRMYFDDSKFYFRGDDDGTTADTNIYIRKSGTFVRAITTADGYATQDWVNNTFSGSTNITTLGTIGTGTWQGSAIQDGYISSATTWSAKMENTKAAVEAVLTGTISSHNHDGTYEPANSNIQSHISSTSNPHSVTAAQTNALEDDTSSEQEASVSKLHVQSTTSTEKFTIEYNETDDTLDFIFASS
jgi:hypothetical protein